MAEVTIKLDSPIITTDKSISEITTDGLANTGEIALASDGIVGNVNGKLRKYPNPIKTFYVEKFVANGAAKWGFEPKDVKTNDVVIIKTATESLMFTVAEATNTKATLCAFTKKGGTRIVFGQKIGGTIIGTDKERVADEYTGITYEYSLSEDLSLTDVNPFTIGQDALKCVPSYYTQTAGGKSYLKLSYNKEYLLPIGASYKNYNCVFYFIVNHKGQQKLVALNTSAPNLFEPITTSLSFVDLVRIEALDNGDASASFVAGRNLKVNGWEFYWKDVWEESEPSAIKHIESAGVNAAINEIKGTGADVSAFTFPTTKDEFIAYLKTITFDFSNQPNQVSGYGSVTYGIMNKNAGTTTIVEGMRNAVPDKIHRSHIEGQYMTFPDVEYALDCHVEGQDCNIVGYASTCHLEGNGSAVVHSMGKNVGFFEEACACHVEGGGGVVGGAYSHVEGDGCAALNNGAHCEGKGYYKNSVTDWKKRTNKDNDYLKDLWKKILFGKTDTGGYTYKFSAAIGLASHVEGTGNIAPKAYATLEGLDTGATASFVNGANHAEGAGNLAGAAASHAEGIRNEIGDNAYASHAEGIKNTTQNRAEHASGQYNKSNKATDTFGDAGNTLFSVGCGTSDGDRKNAFEVMQDGTCKYYDVATGEQIDVGVAKELSKPFDLTIGSTTKKVDGKSAVTFTAEEINASRQFNGVLIQKLTTASAEADIRRAFTEVNTKTVLFPTPGSIISKLDGGNKGIVVSLSEPDVTTLGRTITVYHGNDTYTIIVKSDFTKVLMPWSKVSPKRNVYTNDVKHLNPEYDEARIKDYLTPQVYREYNIVYPVKPQTGDLVEEYHRDKLRYVAINVVRNKENPNEYTDILIPESGTANAYTRIVLKNDLTAVKSYNPYYILKTCKRAYDGDLLLALDTVKAETIENSISDAYSFSIEGRNTQLAAQLPEVGDLIETYGDYAPVCEVVVEPRTFIQHTRWFYKGKLYEVTVNTALTRVPEDPKVIYDTTSGTLRDLYISAGAKYNEATGFYELNGLTDITEEEMRTIWQEDLSGWYLKGRTNLTRNISARGNAGGYNGGIDICNICYNNSNITKFNFGTAPFARYLDNAFSGCTKLETIDTRFPITPYGGIIGPNIFRNCPALKEVRFNMRYVGSSTNVNFPASSLISKDSVLSVIKTTKTDGSVKPLVVVGLNESAYNRLKDDTDITAALTEKNGFVTLTQI